MEYPYNSPIIMTDALFQQYGGLLADTIPEMRTAAYWIAERLVSEDLETFLLPTIVTGTYAYSSRLLLDHSHVNNVRAVKFYDYDNRMYWQTSGSVSQYSALEKDGLYGVIELARICTTIQYGHYVPQRVEVVYTTGLPSGTSYQPNILLALTTVSKIMLNEMLGFGNESPGDVGVQRFSNQNYSESRVALLRTTYGTSAQAQFVHKLLGMNRIFREVGL